jgi:predicted ATPase/class 3 adenylate cyclase
LVDDVMMNEHNSINAFDETHRPSGTVIFLFTDIEGSTRLWERNPSAMRLGFSRQEKIIRDAITTNHGFVYKMIGDAFQSAFDNVKDAIFAAISAQLALQAEVWGALGMLRVRMAIHVGVVEERPDDYVGPTLNRVARILSAGYGNQILVNQPVFDLCRDTLLDQVSFRDLGEYLLKDLVHPEHIYQITYPGLQKDFPPLIASRASNKLPIQDTPFIGRQSEAEHIMSLLSRSDCRLISIVGLGGCGKTRLAVYIANMCQIFEDGVCFASLTEANSSGDIISRMAVSMGYSFYSSSDERLSNQEVQDQFFGYLRNKHMLIVLDNFEHLISDVSVIVHLLENSTKVKLIVTSRERLNLYEEWVVEVGGLPCPADNSSDGIASSDAVRLFMQCAERSGIGVSSREELNAVVKICRLLDGLPLGLEMAASWIRYLSCVEICKEIEKNIDFLATRHRNVNPHHATLRKVFDHSWNLLEESEKILLLRLAVFHGNFTLDFAQAITGARIENLLSLTDKSFLRKASFGRFEIQPILRPFVIEHFQNIPLEVNMSRSKHAYYYSDWIIGLEKELKGSHQFAAMALLRLEIGNILIAWDWLIENREIRRLQSLILILILFDIMNDQPIIQPEFNRRLEKMLLMLERNQPNDSPLQEFHGLFALVLGAIYFFKVQSEPEIAIQAQMRAYELIKIMPDTSEKAYALLLIIFYHGGLSPEEALNLALLCIRLFDQLTDLWGKGLALVSSADAAFFGMLEMTLAKNYYQQGLVIFSEMGNSWGKALCLSGLAYISEKLYQFADAELYARESVEVLLSLENGQRAVHMAALAGRVAEAMKKFDLARHYYQLNQSYFRRMGDLNQVEHYENLSGSLPAKEIK